MDMGKRGRWGLVDYGFRLILTCHPIPRSCRLGQTAAVGLAKAGARSVGILAGLLGSKGSCWSRKRRRLLVPKRKKQKLK